MLVQWVSHCCKAFGSMAILAHRMPVIYLVQINWNSFWQRRRASGLKVETNTKVPKNLHSVVWPVGKWFQKWFQKH